MSSEQVSFVVSSFPVGLRGIGPSDLGECALVRCCSGGTFIRLVGMDCYVLGPKKFVSGNILVLKVTIFSMQSVFANFKTLKI